MRKQILTLALGLAAWAGYGDFNRAVVTWDFPRTTCHEGIPFGNAQSGFLVYGGSNELCVTVGRDDTWDHRGGYVWHDDQNYTNIVAVLQMPDAAKRMKTLFRPPVVRPGEPKNPTIIPVGRYDFTLPQGVRLHTGRLDTATGLGEITVVRGEDDAAVGTISLALDRPSGVLAIQWPAGMAVTGAARPAWKKNWVSVGNDPPICLPPPERFALDAGEGFVQPLAVDPAIGSGFVQAHGTAFVVAVRGADVAAAAECVRQTLSEQVARGYAAVAAHSRQFWADWWRDTPEIDVPDAAIREMHDFGMYKFGSMAGADGVPAPLQGPWIEDYRLPPWRGDYHFNINVQLCYWPAFRGNHLDALMPLFRMILAWRPLMRENARKFAGIDDGYMLPHSVDDRGTLIGGYWAGTMDFAVTPWICQMMMRYVRMSGDRAFLGDGGAFDLMKGTMRVLRALMRDDGATLAYPVSTSPEFDKRGGWGENSSFQLAATHRLARDLVDAARLLDAPVDPMWTDVMRRLPSASFAGGRPGGEIELWRGLTLPETHRHHSHLAGFVPFDTLDMADRAVRDSMCPTLHRFALNGMGAWSGWSYGWAAMLQTRWGNAEAAELLLQHWARMFTNPGHGSRHDVFYPGLSVMRRSTRARAFGVAGDAPGDEIMQIDGAMACTAAVHAMMLDESCGRMYVFRGAPARWRDCAFRNVLSDNGTLVSAVRRDGEVRFVELVSARGGSLALVSPWDGLSTIDVTLKPGETRRLTRLTKK